MRMCGIEIDRVALFAKFTSSFLNRNHLFGKEFFMIKFSKTKEYRNNTAICKDNVICYVGAEVVLCR